MNNETVPYLENSKAVNENGITFLDTREINEFETSHIKNAIWVGYDSFDSQIINDSVPDKTTPIVVYCSIGVRSEDIGEKLQEMGYSNVRNLYGGIFKWKNDGYPVFDQENKETEKVHAYDKLWGKLLTKGEKVYE
ncbi:hypothetical protein FB2170_08404 [Maribacter sp. HTCC2170]|nr:hypothetical protein FB2170_08404 [Maribacter sp. HTCC2170]